jgi:transposase
MMSVGIDSHRDSLAMCVLAESGAILAEREYPNTPAGHRALGRFLARYGEKRRIGIEGSGCFGGAAADHLRGCGEEVCEVPAGRTWRERRHLGRPGKSDAGDAEAIARVVASGARLPSVGRPPAAAELKLLCDERDALCEERTRALNRLHALLRRYLPGYRAAVGTLRSGAGRARLARLLDAGDGLWVELARRHLERITSLEDECAQLAGQIEALLEASGSSLREINGIGTLTAARLLVEIGRIERFAGRASFAMAAGVAPIPASSGTTRRYRLNRGGNRRLNHALHTIALVQARHDQRARAYLERKRSQGMSRLEAIRCLKRQLANVVYRQMVRDALQGG